MVFIDKVLKDMAATTTFVSSPNVCSGLSRSLHPLIVRDSVVAGPSGLHLSSMAPFSRSPAAAARDYNLDSMVSSPVFLQPSSLRTRSCGFTMRAERPDGVDESGESLDISVFRFTLGIPGFDDSDLPRILGIVFGGLLILNHALSLSSITAAQLSSRSL